MLPPKAEAKDCPTLSSSHQPTPVSSTDKVIDRRAVIGGLHPHLSGQRSMEIVPDKWADLCCIDLARPHTQPAYDPAAQIVYAASREQVTDVWVAGRMLVRDRELTHLDIDAVLQRAELWRQRIAAQLSQ